ncbi:hypothetical protein [Nesterenkonia pannonica]|uniref:ABC transporter permease n=1 Tax=Nesterenkonia pannonica TaxID=1548602 RepID=UPI002164A0B3|nr:ABC transporter permease [Nesterenkonia pannonica]
MAISTAFIVAGLLLVGSFNASVAEEAEAEAAGADLIIRTDSLIDGQDPDAWDDYEQDSELERHADEDLMEQVEALDSVASAEPVRSAFLETSAAREADGVPFGVSASQLTDSMEFEMLDGEAPSADDEAMVSEVAAEAFGISVGDTLTASLQVADEESNGGGEAEGRILETDYEVVGIADLPGSPRSLLTEGAWRGCRTTPRLRRSGLCSLMARMPRRIRKLSRSRFRS